MSSRLCRAGRPDLSAGSPFPQETLKLLLCGGGCGGCRPDVGGGLLTADRPAVVRGRLHGDAARGEARLGDRHLKLERRPLVMLQLLANRSGEVVPRGELLERVWGTSYTGFEHSMEQAVHQVRRELREPGWIETVRGIGYRFVVQSLAGG